DWEEAETYLIDLNNNFPNFYKKIEGKIKKRNESIGKLVRDRIQLSAYELDNWVYANTRHEDSSCSFYCRLILFSDVQFTSI
ncbi:hypothetical protein, partial [Paenibacillus helianthi]|uniref:hypothetical protein n=1 Tax=Paenibacillus helianthi TaxID=1349432 RepID=UPI000A87EB9B